MVRQAAKPTLLLAEDNESVAVALVRLLGDDFDVVAIVRDGSRLVELAHSLRPHVIIADVGLDGLDGISATKIIRQRDSVTPILIITASPDPYVETHARESGASRFLSKIDGMSELRAVVLALLRSD